MGAAVQLYDQHSRPLQSSSALRPQNSFGRHISRRAAKYSGTLTSWTVRYISSRLAEREKRIASDRALDLYMNSSMAHDILEGLLTEVVGTGLTPQPSPMIDWLGLTSDWQTEWTKKAYAWFEIIGMDPRKWVDATRRQTIYGLQSLALFN